MVNCASTLDNRTKSVYLVQVTRDLSKGAQLLYRWRLDKSLRQRDVAVLLDTDVAHISKLELGRRRPGRRLAVAIEHVTNGAVPCGYWDDPPLPSHVVDPDLNPDFDFFLETKPKKKR